MIAVKILNKRMSLIKYRISDECNGFVRNYLKSS